jgi:ATP synthase protein I
MSDPERRADSTRRDELVKKIAAKERRKLRARRQRDQSVWFGLGMFGLVGWSVAIPMLVCLALGLWIDRTYPSGYSWTLMFLFIGVALGALNAWYWVSREGKLIEASEEDDRE